MPFFKFSYIGLLLIVRFWWDRFTLMPVPAEPGFFFAYQIFKKSFTRNMTPSDVPCVSVHYQPTHNYVYYHEQILKIYGNGMDPPDFSEQPSHYGNRTRVRRMVRKRESNALTARFCSNS